MSCWKEQTISWCACSYTVHMLLRWREPLLQAWRAHRINACTLSRAAWLHWKGRGIHSWNANTNGSLNMFHFQTHQKRKLLKTELLLLLCLYKILIITKTKRKKKTQTKLNRKDKETTILLDRKLRNINLFPIFKHIKPALLEKQYACNRLKTNVES